MRIFPGLPDPYDIPDGEWAIPLSVAQEVKIPGEPDLFVVETPERNPGRLWEFLRRCCPAEYAECCAVLAAADDFSVKKRRAANLYDLPPETLTAGELWLAGWFLRPERQYLGKRFAIHGHEYLALAMDTGERNMSLWLATPRTGETGPVQEAATKREETRTHMAHRREWEDMPGECAADGVNYPCGAGRMSADMRQGRFLREYWKDRLPPEWEKVEFVELSWDARNDEDAEKQAPGLPVRSLRLLKAGTESREYPVEKVFTARVGEQDEPVFFADPQGGEPLCFYMEGLQLVDVNENVRGKPGIDQSALLPENLRVLALAYELASPRYQQLDFHFREEMDQNPEENWPPADHPFLRRYTPRHVDEDGALCVGGSVGWLFFGREKGPHGFRKQFCSLGPVDAHFSGEAVLELTGVYEHREDRFEIEILEV